MFKTLTQKIERQNRWLMIFLLAVAFCVTYLGTNHFGLLSPWHLTLYRFEEAIPLIPWTVFVYLSAYLMIAAAVLLFAKKDYGRAVAGLVLIMIFHGIIFLFLPTAYPRPIFPTDAAGISKTAYDLLIFLDTPKNCFPSLHVAATVFVSLVLFRRNKILGLTFMAWTILIVISTLTTKQHYFLDVEGGVVVGTVGYILMFWKKI